MKFDVVIGNPPYQHPIDKKTKLWALFLDQALKFAKQHVSFVTPDVWVFENNKVAKQVRKMLADKNLKYINTKANDYFTVGESICSYQIDLTSLDGNTELILGEKTDVVKYTGQKLHRSLKDEKIHDICMKIFNYENKLKGTISRFISKRPEDLNENYIKESNEEFSNRVYISSTESYYTRHDTSSHKGPKLIFNNSGYYYKPAEPDRYMWVEDEGVAVCNTFQLNVNNLEEAINAKSFYSSKLCRFFVDNTKSGGFNASCLYSLPLVDYTKSWTDEEIYQHFQLTQEEINLIESTVS